MSREAEALRLLTDWIKYDGTPWVYVEITDDAGYADDGYYVCAMCGANSGAMDDSRHEKDCQFPHMQRLVQP